MKLYQILRKGIIVSILYGLAAVCGYLGRLFLSHYVPLDEFGLFYSTLTFVLAFSIFCDISFGQILQVYIPELRKKQLWGKIKGYVTAVLCWQVVTRVLVISFLIAIAPFLANYYFKDPQAAILIYLFSFSFLLSGFGSFTAGLIGFHKFGTAAFLNLFRIFSFLAGIYFAFWFRRDVVFAAGAYLVSMLATDALTFILFLKRAMPRFFRVKMVFNKSMFMDMFKFGIMLTLSSLAMQIIGIADTLTLTYFRPLSELGIYQMALPTATIVTFLIAWPVGLMVPATLAHMARNQQKKLIEHIRILLLFFVVPIVAVLVVFSGEILQILFNQSSVLGAWMLRFLAVNQVLLLLIQFSNSTLTGLKRAKELLRISIIVSVVIVIMSIIGTMLFGPIGTILGYFVSFCVFLGLAGKAITKVCGAKTPWKEIIKILAIGALSTGIIYATSKLALPVLLNIAVSGLAGQAAYAVLAVWAGILDIELIKGIIKR